MLVAASAVAMAAAAPARAEEAGLVTSPSRHGVRETLDRFTAAVRAKEWVVFAEIDHAAAAAAVGMTLRPRVVVFFGNPRAGTGPMATHPTLAIDLPMRVLVWQDDAGQTQVTRNTGADIASRVFARHGVIVPPPAQRATDAFIEDLVRQAAE
jgi:uncharacterized protein (DUF302 family)